MILDDANVRDYRNLENFRMAAALAPLLGQAGGNRPTGERAYNFLVALLKHIRDKGFQTKNAFKCPPEIAQVRICLLASPLHSRYKPKPRRGMTEKDLEKNEIIPALKELLGDKFLNGKVFLEAWNWTRERNKKKLIGAESLAAAIRAVELDFIIETPTSIIGGEAKMSDGQLRKRNPHQLHQLVLNMLHLLCLNQRTKEEERKEIRIVLMEETPGDFRKKEAWRKLNKADCLVLKALESKDGLLRMNSSESVQDELDPSSFPQITFDQVCELHPQEE